MKKICPGKVCSLVIGLIVFILVPACEEIVVLDNPVDPEAQSYVGYNAGDKDNDGVSDLYDIDHVTLLEPNNDHAVLSQAIQFKWGMISTATRYHLQVAGDKDFSSIIIDNDAIPTNIFNDKITYVGDIYWRVRAGDADRWGDNWSDTFTLSFAIAKPVLVGPQNNAVIADATPFFEWDIALEADAYEIRISTTNDFTGDGDIIINSIINTQYELDQRLENNTTYYWQVRAISGDNQGEWSDPFSFNVTIDITVPFDPSPVDNETTTDTLPILNWDYLAVTSGYHLQLSKTADFTEPIVDNTGIYVSEYQLTQALENLESYYWRVRAKNAEGVWGDWNEWRFTIDIGSVTMTSPVDSYNTNEVLNTFSWEVNTRAALYHLRIADAPDFTGIVFEKDDIAGLSYEHTLTMGDIYYWQVRIIDAQGVVGEWSDYHILKLFSIQIVSPADTGTIIDATPLLDWDEALNTKSYDLQLSAVNDFSSLIIDEQNMTDTSYQMPMENLLVNNRTYYWRIRIKDTDDVTGTWCGPWSFTVRVGVPVLESPLDEVQITDTTPLLSWTAHNEAVSYQLQLDESVYFSSSDLISIEDLTADSYQLPVEQALQDSTTYYWRVRLINEDGLYGDWSVVNRFTTDIGGVSLSSPVDGDVTTDTTPIFDWADYSGAQGYDMQISTASDFSSIHSSADNINDSKYQLPIEDVLADDSTYYWRVRVINEDGVYSAWSEGLRFRVDFEGESGTWYMLTYDTTPLLYCPLTAGYTTHIQCDDDSDFSSLHIEFETTDDAYYLPLDKALTIDTPYYFRIRLKNEDNVYSNWVESYTIHVRTQAITGENGETGVFKTGTTPLLNWKDVVLTPFPGGIATDLGVQSYQVQCHTTDDFTTPMIDRVDLTTSEFQIPAGDALTLNTHYYWRVRYKNLDGIYSPWSDTFDFEVKQIVNIATGDMFSFVLMEDGSLWSSGKNDQGQLGVGDKVDRHGFKEVLTGVREVVCSEDFAFAIQANNVLWAVGGNHASLGTGDNVDRERFTPIMGDVESVACGRFHTLALKTDGTLWATGSNIYNQLGTGDDTYRNSFTQVLTDVAKISCGMYNSFAIKTDGTLWVAGDNSSGALGTGDELNKDTFTQVLGDVKSVACYDSHTMALKTDNTLWTTGSNDAGQLGTGDEIMRNTFTQVLTGVCSIACGSSHSLALKTDGTLWTSGRNSSGELGVGDLVHRNTFNQVLTNVNAIAGGKNSDSYALKDDGTLWIAGSDDYGQLGAGGSQDEIMVFTQVLDNTALIAVSRFQTWGDQFTMALKTDGSLWSTGTNNSGQRGVENDAIIWTYTQY